MIYYKVVYKSCYGLESVCRWLPDNYTVLYKVGEWIYPKVLGSKLFVFKTLKHALDFVNSECSTIGNSCEIYKCQVDKAYRIKKLSGIGTVDAYWKKKRSRKRINNYRTVPDGTLSCDCLKLLEKV